ncbi:MAG: hypothetical protein HY053_08810 [Proteobacteria bacterium]|nr:hypothetical protein [Pseudomonadota bacterium]
MSEKKPEILASLLINRFTGEYEDWHERHEYYRSLHLRIENNDRPVTVHREGFDGNEKSMSAKKARW